MAQGRQYRGYGTKGKGLAFGVLAVAVAMCFCMPAMALEVTETYIPVNIAAQGSGITLDLNQTSSDDGAFRLYVRADSYDRSGDIDAIAGQLNGIEPSAGVRFEAAF